MIMTDRVASTKKTIALDSVAQSIPAMLEEIQHEMFMRAQQKAKSLWHKAAKLSEFGPICLMQIMVYTKPDGAATTPLRRSIARV